MLAVIVDIDAVASYDGIQGTAAVQAPGRLITQTHLGAYLGHEAGDSKGQQRYQVDSHDLAPTSTNA